jgi:REP element-mobilizing transposase RayT
VIYADTHLYRHRHLPHLIKGGRTYYVTFCTRHRFFLTPEARDAVLASCIHDHKTLGWVDCCVVMPDHLHFIVAPFESCSLHRIIGRIKSASAYHVNRLTERRGRLWQREAFDHLIRRDESLYEKRDYIANNPVRAALVTDWRDYKWFWRSWAPT